MTKYLYEVLWESQPSILRMLCAKIKVQLYLEVSKSLDLDAFARCEADLLCLVFFSDMLIINVDNGDVQFGY
jgi:hypothetical protein